MNELPYSYHTLLFPFLWNDSGQIKWADFEKVLSVGKRWVETSWLPGEIPDRGNRDVWLQDYAAFQYFTEPANAAIFNTRGDHVVRCFEYRHAGDRVKDRTGKYLITKGSETFRLDMNNIRMNVYNSGVAVLILELENKHHPSIDAVNQINEYGRRITMPFLVSDGDHPVCADRIEFLFDDTSFAVQDNQKILEGFSAKDEEPVKRIGPPSVMRPILKLIDGSGADNGGYEVTTGKSSRDSNGRKLRNDRKVTQVTKELFIRPCIDDRMFVCCVVVDNHLSEEVKGLGSPEYSFLNGWDRRLTVDEASQAVDHKGHVYEDYQEGWADETFLSNRLYQLIFIETELTCQNTRMKKDLLCQSVYSRWLDTGILYAASHHSLICVANENVFSQVIVPFLTQYTQLAILALAQRSTILALSAEASAVAEGFRDDAQILPSQIGAIERLQAKYVKAQNQLFLTEATVQEQGVEIYQLIRQQLYLGPNKAELSEQMNNLRDVANISNERLERKADEELNRNLSWLTLIALVFGIGQTILAFLDRSAPYSGIISGLAALIALIAGVCLLYHTLFKKSKK